MLFEAGDVPQQSNYAKDLNLAPDKVQHLILGFSQHHNQGK